MNFSKKLAAGGRWLGSRFRPKSAILLYHRVAEKEMDPFNLCVSPARFVEQMMAIYRVGTPLPLPEFQQRHREGTLAPGSIAVTFDDAYVDVLENALPILDRFKIPATIFAVTGTLGEPFWWDRLAGLIFQEKPLPDQLALGTNGASLQIRTAGVSRRKLMDAVYPWFERLPAEARNEQLANLQRLTGPKREPEMPRAMTAEELRSIARHPLITVGAHTVNHSRLSTLSYDNQLGEIGSSKRHLEAILDRPVDTFSYPFGLRTRDFTMETIAATRAAGLDHAIAADLGVVTSESDRFALPRLWMHDWDGEGFRKNLNFWL